ncbi:sensor histidine kinase [Nonomuraea typhae]|uniref:sensor histidine kinase n=1 Tax=Nonomuraea typhae TaxID=2603600 RepID=UPI0012FABDFD|nr:sensor histidine kinase [Nonomuraea typhae]
MSRWLAAASAGLTLAALVMRVLLPAAWSPGVPLLPDYAAGLAFPVLGAFLLRRRPGHLLALLMCAGGLTCAVRVAAETGMLTAAAAGELELAGLLRYPAAIARVTGGMLLAGLLPLYSPDGRLPSPRWRPVAGFAALTAALECVRVIVRPVPASSPWPRPIPNPLAVQALAPVNDLLRTCAEAATLAVVVAGLLSLLLRAKDASLRRQLAWPIAAFALYVAFLLAGPAFWAPCLVATALVPVAMAASVLRHRLFGVEVLLGKALVGAGVAGVAGAAYLAVSGTASLFVSGHGQLAGLAAALLTGAAFQPLRVRLRRMVDLAMYGPHGDPQRLARRLAAEVRRSDPYHALADTLTVTADALGVRGLAVRIRQGATVTTGEPGTGGRELPLIWHGEPVGTLVVGPPGARRFTSEYAERLVWTAVPYLADVTHAVQMCDDLRRSRERRAAAWEEERRRLRDGLRAELGQTLAGASRSLRLAGTSLRSSPSAADRLLGDVGTDVHDAAMRVRELLHGLSADREPVSRRDA